MVAGTTGAVLTQVPAPLHSNPPGQQGPTELQAPAVHPAVAAGGRVQTPGRFRPMFIGREAIFGIWRDRDEVQHARGYPLRKG